MKKEKIKEPTTDDESSQKKKKLILNCAIIAIAVILVVCAVLIVLKVVGYKKAKDTYSDISDDVNDIIENNKDEKPEDSWTRPEGWVGLVPDDNNPGTPNTPGAPDVDDPTTPGTPSDPNTNTPGLPNIPIMPPGPTLPGDPEPEPEIQHSQLYLDMKAVLDRLKAENPEVYGYLQVEICNSKGTHKISYPIMRSKTDNDYYLDHMYNGEKNESGSIFVMDYAYDKIEYNHNLVMFGHNMQNGGMFNKLNELLRSEEAFMGVKGKDKYYTDIMVFTYDGIYKFDVFAAYSANSTDTYCKAYFDTSGEFVEFCNTVQGNSKWSKNYEFFGSDRILTFSTCTNNLVGDDRIAVHALLVSISQ